MKENIHTEKKVGFEQIKRKEKIHWNNFLYIVKESYI